MVSKKGKYKVAEFGCVPCEPIFAMLWIGFLVSYVYNYGMLVLLVRFMHS